MPTEPRYLLIIACSQRKRSNPGLLPAIERYDGVNFRVLRKARREGYWPKNLDVLILSAKYGLLGSETEIDAYDLRMSWGRAMELRPTLGLALAERVKAVPYTEIFVNLGKIYRLALDRWETALNEDLIVIYASGGCGQKAAQMRRWLLQRATEKG